MRACVLMRSLRNPKTNKRSTRDTNGVCNLTNENRYISMLCVRIMWVSVYFDPYGIRHMRRGNHSFWLCMNGCMCLCLSVIEKRGKLYVRNAPKSSTIFNLISRKWKSSSPLLFPNTTSTFVLHYFFPIRFITFTHLAHRIEQNEKRQKIFIIGTHILWTRVKASESAKGNNKSTSTTKQPSRYINIKKEKRKIIWSTVISYTMTS